MQEIPGGRGAPLPDKTEARITAEARANAETEARITVEGRANAETKARNSA